MCTKSLLLKTVYRFLGLFNAQRVGLPVPLFGERFYGWDLDLVGGFCGCDAPLSYGGYVRNCGCSVQFQVLCVISLLVDSAGFLGNKLHKYR